MHSNDSAWQAFRVSLISPLITGQVAHEQRERYFHEVASQTHYTPEGATTVSVRTLRRWYLSYRQEGLDGLKRKRRSDLGKPRPANRQKVDRAEALKRELPSRSDITINKVLETELVNGLATSTLYRHLRIRGATKKQLGVDKEKVRCRWTRDTPNALWMGDFSHGPKVLVNGVVRQSHLSVWIDCHSRFLVDAHYYERENFDCLVDSLLRAWAKHGCSRELYADNGKIYHAHGLTLACAQLQIHKLHRPPREPQPGGLVERVFQTIGSQFQAEVEHSRATLTLNELNRAAEAYLATTYHQTIHSQTNQTPYDRFYSSSRLIRPVAVESVQSYFFDRVVRRVDPTHSDVSIDKRVYKVDRKWRTMRVLVEFDPFRIDGDSPDEVSIFNEQGIYLGIGKRYQRERGAHEESMHATAESHSSRPDRSPVIESYLAEHAKMQSEAEQGIDYRTALKHGQLSLSGLASLLGKHLGRAGGLSGFKDTEQMALDTLIRNHPQVRSLHVQEALKAANGEGLLAVLWHLERLLQG